MRGHGCEIVPAVVPNQSNGFWPRFANMIWAARHQGDVNHVTGDVHYLALLLRPDRTILTIHDCYSLERLKGLKRWLLRMFWFELPIRRAAIVTVISEETKRQLLRHVHVSADKVHVIPDIISPLYRPCPRPFRSECPKILHIGTKINKNLLRLISARHGLNCHLHIVGHLNGIQTSALKAAGIAFSTSCDLTELEMYECYCDADLVAFVSTYEGFGLPIVEANAVGRPVVTSSISSMPEVAGNAACLVDPYDVASIRLGIRCIIEEPEYRAQLIENGFQNTQRFQADAIARKYLDLYRNAFEQFQTQCVRVQC